MWSPGLDYLNKKINELSDAICEPYCVSHAHSHTTTERELINKTLTKYVADDPVWVCMMCDVFMLGGATACQEQS